ncbi:Cak1 monomeric CDK-activating kinase [Candida orthopsilosis Co 90-125]|uniref:Cak1 monomeric CDK-activating kinase n=1 Tax=Candida orthopsilosis (strain 90-125) TaxID=1136231 RepID=H8WXC7_CANO9|nr:Cak1 monomeric CDK-activating kinase [Candida orthopsilosis Co 90-125]CCG21432.1 Cak1 monomeric CDK-activating kinase [Candida orthopsilosis Co 90-125]
MKLDDLYTDKQLICNSPISDICKAKPKTTNASTSDYVCLKIVDVDFKIPPHSIRREIKAIKALQDHDGIVKYIDDFQIYEDVILVLDYYSYNLSQLMKHKKYCRKRTRYNLDGGEGSNELKYILSNIIPQSQAKQFVTNLISAVKFIHANDIIHRDLKPSNLLFINDDITHPVIADFGVCYNLLDPPQDEPLMQKYTDVCTGIYKSPELLLSVTNYSFEVDIWSIAIVLTVFYSPDFKSVLIREDHSGGGGEGGEGGNNDDEELNDESNISDLHLLSCIFKVFGTPSYNRDDVGTDEEREELYWPELDDDNLHFKKFNLKKFKRMGLAEIIPKCEDEEVKQLFQKMTRYDRIKRSID